MSNQPRNTAVITLKVFVLASAILFFASCSESSKNEVSESSKKEVIDGKALFQEVQVLGQDEKVIDGILGRPSFVVTTEAGDVYVADDQDLYIKVYSSSGEYKFRFAGLGEGPGELKRINGMTINKKNEIVIADGMQEQLTFYSAEGNFIHSISVKELIPNPRIVAIHHWKDNLYILVCGVPSYAPDLRTREDANIVLRMLRVNDEENSLSYTKEFISKVKDLGYPELISDFIRGGSVTSDKENLYFAPRNHTGEILSYNNIDGNWSKDKVLKGYVEIDKPIELVDFPEENPLKYERFSQGNPSGDFKGIVFNSSKGLFKLLDGNIAHFSYIRKKDEAAYEFGVDLFTKEGEFIDRFSIPNKEGTSTFVNFEVVHQDNRGNFYLVTLWEPVVYVKKLIIQ